MWENLKFCCIFYTNPQQTSHPPPGGIGAKFLETVAFFADSRNRPRNDSPQNFPGNIPSPQQNFPRNTPHFSNLLAPKFLPDPTPSPSWSSARWDVLFYCKILYTAANFSPHPPQIFSGSPQSVRWGSPPSEAIAPPRATESCPLAVIPIVSGRQPLTCPQMLQICYFCNILKNFYFPP